MAVRGVHSIPGRRLGQLGPNLENVINVVKKVTGVMVSSYVSKRRFGIYWIAVDCPNPGGGGGGGGGASSAGRGRKFSSSRGKRGGGSKSSRKVSGRGRGKKSSFQAVDDY